MYANKYRALEQRKELQNDDDKRREMGTPFRIVTFDSDALDCGQSNVLGDNRPRADCRRIAGHSE